MPKNPTNLKAKLNKPPNNTKYYLIAIDGRGGAGKTTFSKYLMSLLPDFSFICGDVYFEPVDHPITSGGFNEERFQEDVITPLNNSETTINFRPYIWDSNPHIKDIPVTITKGVFIDRVYSFSFDLNYDLKIWVDTPRDVTITRGIGRSSMPEIEAEKVWQKLWKPLEDSYISKSNPIKLADIVIDGTKPFDQQIV